MSSPVWLVMPLYIYPLTETTWKPLYDVIEAYPDLNFLVIVNPNSGPGDADLPSHDYVREVPKLNSYPNVCTVGYVRIDYCRRPLNQSYEDIRLYAGWSNRDDIPGLYVQGVFVDETPNHVSPERTQYLSAVTHFIKATEGLGGDRLVIQNPGTVPEGDLAAEFGNPDLVCVSEEPYSKYCGEGVQQRLKQYSVGRSRSFIQVSDVPLDDFGPAVRQMCEQGQYVFATDLVEDFYESFGPSWAALAAALNRYNKEAKINQAGR